MLLSKCVCLNLGDETTALEVEEALFDLDKKMSQQGQEGGQSEQRVHNTPPDGTTYTS